MEIRKIEDRVAVEREEKRLREWRE